MAKGNYVMEYGNFQQLAGGTYTKFGFDCASTTVKYMLDGEYKEITSNTWAEITAPDADLDDDRYDLIVIRGGVCVDIPGTSSSTPTIGDMNDDDVPVALVKVAGDSGNNITTREVQLFTFNKDANSASIGYNSASSVYTNVGTLTASAAGLLVSGITSTVFTTPFMSIGNGATNAGELRFLEDTDNGSHYTGFKAPAAVTSNAVYTLPAAFPGSDSVLQSNASGVLSWSAGVYGDTQVNTHLNTAAAATNEVLSWTGSDYDWVVQSGGTVTALNNQTANRLITIGATTTELDGEANLTFDGSELGLTGNAEITHSTSSPTTAGLKVDKDYTGTVTSSNRGVYVDFDATGITASGQTSDNYCYLGVLNSDAPTMVGTVNNYGAYFTLTGATSGVQKNVGIHAQVAGADTNYPIIALGGNSGFGTATPSRLLSITDTDGGTNAVQPVFRLTEFSAGVTPANGLGVGIEFEVSTAVGNEEIIATIDAIAADVSSGAEIGHLSFKTMKGGATATEVLRLGDDAGNDILFTGNQGNGLVKLTAATNAASTFEDKRYVLLMRATAIGATMPAGIEGRTYNFKNSHAGQVTLTCAGSDNFRKLDASMGGTATTLVLDPGQYAEVIFNAADAMWEVMIIGNSI